ncbi:MAG TPA: O-antigen ligase family protein [Pyrinomonadaceae bacterium]|jgi:O-antigen ligase
MKNFLEKFDALAAIEVENTKARWLERIAFAFLILMILSAPHSIAASQTAWLTGMFVWLIRLFISPRPRLFRSVLDVPLWVFFVWSIVSSIFSYAPDISINKLRGAALFLIFYFVINNLRNARAVRFLALALVFSCMVNVVWMPIQRIIGRGVEIHGVAPDSPLAKAVLIDGDALLEADGVKLRAPEDLVAQIEKSDVTKVKFYRPDFEFVVDIKRENLLGGRNALERLGIESWKKSRNWRSAGFYGHYATYAEVLQLILSLTFGLFIASFSTRRRRYAETEKINGGKFSSLFTFHFSLFMFLCVALMSLALLLTVTRASQLGFLVSAVVVVLANGNRKLILALAAIILPVIVGGLIFLQQSRQVGFFDAKDDSTIYRQTMWRDGYRLWTDNARNFTLGVGMDSIQRYWREWNLYDGGRLPQGHFHSTPLQLAVERGLPALLLWLWIVGVYARALWREIKLRIANCELRIEDSEKQSAIEIGVLLGSLGGLAGFLTSGLVHYNLGDQEVEMVFFILMGLSVFLVNGKLKMQN